MKFEIFSLREKTYKVVTFIIVVAVTILCICYYTSLEDKSDTFIMATLYATFLFIVGLYLSNKSRIIGDKIYERKSYYITLIRLREMFRAFNLVNEVSNADLTKAIITFQVFTGRSRDQSKDVEKNAILHTVPLDIFMDNLSEPLSNNELQQKDIQKHYINENGFTLTSELQSLENSYFEYSSHLNAKFNKTINDYINENNIQLTINKFYEMDLLDTNYEEWCNENIKQVSSDKKEDLIEFIYQTVKEFQTEFDILEAKRRKLVKYYEKCSKRVDENLKRLKATYGNRLGFIINTRDDILFELTKIKEQLYDIEKSIGNSLSTVEEEINDCKISLLDLSEQLVDTQNNLIVAIDTMQFTLEDKLELLDKLNVAIMGYTMKTCQIEK